MVGLSWLFVVKHLTMTNETITKKSFSRLILKMYCPLINYGAESIELKKYQLNIVKKINISIAFIKHKVKYLKRRSCNL